MSRSDAQPHGVGYEIRVRGHLDHRWAAWLDELELSHADDGTTLLRAHVPDQAALHGLLHRVRDIGLPLISVVQVDPSPAAPPPDKASPTQNRSTT